MKVPPKRKGNFYIHGGRNIFTGCLNESPSEKEGKYLVDLCHGLQTKTPQ